MTEAKFEQTQRKMRQLNEKTLSMLIEQSDSQRSHLKWHELVLFVGVIVLTSITTILLS